MQIRDVSEVPYLSFSDLGSNKGLCSLFQSPLFEVSTGCLLLFEFLTANYVMLRQKARECTFVELIKLVIDRESKMYGKICKEAVEHRLKQHAATSKFEV